MPENRIVNHYSLEMEVTPDNGTSRPVRVMATNRSDETKTAEVQMTFDEARRVLDAAYGNEQTVVEQFIADLRDHGYVKLTAQAGRPDTLFVFMPGELVNFGFRPDDFAR